MNLWINPLRSNRKSIGDAWFQFSIVLEWFTRIKTDSQKNFFVNFDRDSERVNQIQGPLLSTEFFGLLNGYISRFFSMLSKKVSKNMFRAFSVHLTFFWKSRRISLFLHIIGFLIFENHKNFGWAFFKKVGHGWP